MGNVVHVCPPPAAGSAMPCSLGNEQAAPWGQLGNEVNSLRQAPNQGRRWQAPARLPALLACSVGFGWVSAGSWGAPRSGGESPRDPPVEEKGENPGSAFARAVAPRMTPSS